MRRRWLLNDIVNSSRLAWWSGRRVRLLAADRPDHSTRDQEPDQSRTDLLKAEQLYAGAVEGIGEIAAEAQQEIGATTSAQPR
jgi:hypothetical protein